MGRKWANIVAKKTAKDGANSKIYAKFGVEIYVAAKQGEPDPESNSALKFVLERAKQAQVPKHVIDKAIDKAKGNTDETFVEGRYEGFGPNSSMIIVQVQYHTCLIKKVSLYLLAKTQMLSLSNCLKQM